MYMKIWSQYPLLPSLDSYKVCLCFIVLSVTVCTVLTVGYVCSFCEDQISCSYFVSFLSMIIYEVLYTWCIRHNICSPWFLDIRISTCIHLLHPYYSFAFRYILTYREIWYIGFVVDISQKILVMQVKWSMKVILAVF